ncbi:MAG: hypothetical protein IPI12_04770 [Ignavibacteriales bacterium]|nr:hypothetical protein [Ignavibacteriales bacterium]
MIRTYYWFAGAMVFGIGLLLISPFYAINPGVLSKGHESLQNDCMSCHTLVQGAVTEKCVTCHKQNNIGRVLVSGILATKTNERANLLHKNIKEINCVVCHREHTGESKDLAIKKFSHEIIGSGVKEKCSACHDYQKPKGDFHSELKAECSGCHNTNRWNDAKFNHKQGGIVIDNCGKCHEKDKPSDDLHKNFKPGESCSACHTTDAWKPSTFDHSKYFIFDKDHTSTCTNCHEPGNNFKTYTCYNCHEHTQAKISREHLKEGISDFANCVKCHRSSNKEGLEGGEGSEKKHEGKKKDHGEKEGDED